MRRRPFLSALSLFASSSTPPSRAILLRLLRASASSAFGSPIFAALALPQRTLQFPRDFGAHPDLRTEWWYVTGFAQSQGREFGFQLTFFRTRIAEAQPLRSKFAAKQLLFAHAALTDVQGRRLWHDQRIAREGFGVAQASTADTRVQLRDWQLVRAP